MGKKNKILLSVKEYVRRWMLGEQIKSVSLEVPAKIVYEGIKSTMARYATFTIDSRKGLSSPYKLVKDVADSLLAFSSGGWGAKAELEYTFRRIGETSTEVTIRYKYNRLVLEVSIRQEVTALVRELLMLESGYKSHNT